MNEKKVVEKKVLKKNSDIAKLEKEILHHKHLYYSGKPLISDEEFDKKEEQLRLLNPESHALKLVGTTSQSNKLAHKQKMLSLSKVYSLEELLTWQEGRELVGTLKIDGVSGSLIYKKGKFVLGKTRGDGSHGEDITLKIMWIDSIAKELRGDFKNLNAEIRGEILCTEESFIELSDEMDKRGLARPSSQRNIVAGLISRKDHLDLCRYLDFYAFDLISENPNEKRTEKKETQKVKKLESIGFKTPYWALVKNKNEITQFISKTQEELKSGKVLIDGAVFSFNDLNLQEKLGSTSHHPRYKKAFKFKGVSAQTTIEEITWSISRTGIFTPVANVKPVQLSGASISRVTLHNYGVVKSHNIKAQDEIEIIRSGEVIPKFLNVISSTSGKPKLPVKCPHCASELKYEDIRIRCINEDCPGIQKEVILNYLQKIGIEDISAKRLDEMMSASLLNKVEDLYDISRDDFLTLSKVKEKLADKFYVNIEKSKKPNLVSFMNAIGVSGGALNKTQKIIDSGVNTIEKFLSLDLETLLKVESFAHKSATEYIESLNQKKKMIRALLAKGVTPLSTSNDQGASSSENTSLYGLSFCITGTLSRKRSEIEKDIVANGGRAMSSVSKETSYLITNETNLVSSKAKKALKLDIKIITEEKFYKLIRKKS